MFDLSGAHRVEVMERNEAIPAAEKPHFSKIARSGAPYQAVASIRALQMWATRPFVLAEIVGGREKEIVESHIIHIFRFTQLSRLALTVLAIMTEVSTHFELENYESIVYLWQIFTDQVPEGKDMYDQRYKILIDASRT